MPLVAFRLGESRETEYEGYSNCYEDDHGSDLDKELEEVMEGYGSGDDSPFLEEDGFFLEICFFRNAGKDGR